MDKKKHISIHYGLCNISKDNENLKKLYHLIIVIMRAVQNVTSNYPNGSKYFWLGFLPFRFIELLIIIRLTRRLNCSSRALPTL
jgi:hypothetical protein